MHFLLNDRRSAPRIAAPLFPDDPQPVLDLLRACPAHAETPMVRLDALARRGGLSALYAKLESSRMGLGSFKALGGAYAVASIILERVAAATGGTADADALVTPEARSIAADLTFVCASAGNHGLSVAAGARVFGARSMVYLSGAVPAGFLARLRDAGATVREVGATYEDSMEAAKAAADAQGWILLSDSSWPGYTTLSGLVMQGYSVLVDEAVRQMADTGVTPTHAFLQAGVGGMAAAVAVAVRPPWGASLKLVVVEPAAAPCLIASAAAGRPVRADGPVSAMGRLDCKEPSLIAFETLRDEADAFMTVTEREASDAADLLAGEALPTTPSGAAGLAGLLTACADRDMADALALDPASIPLIIISEGAVD